MALLSVHTHTYISIILDGKVMNFHSLQHLHIHVKKRRADFFFRNFHFADALCTHTSHEVRCILRYGDRPEIWFVPSYNSTISHHISGVMNFNYLITKRQKTLKLVLKNFYGRKSHVTSSSTFFSVFYVWVSCHSIRMVWR
jgi:hypothetical protein